MNTPDSFKITIAAPVLSTPLSKTEVAIQPAPPYVRRVLRFPLDADFADTVNSAGFVPRGRWDSARVVARELLVGLIPTRPAPTSTLLQLELQFA